MLVGTIIVIHVAHWHMKGIVSKHVKYNQPSGAEKRDQNKLIASRNREKKIYRYAYMLKISELDEDQNNEKKWQIISMVE